jgi:hypothetical protein
MSSPNFGPFPSQLELNPGFESVMTAKSMDFFHSHHAWVGRFSHTMKEECEFRLMALPAWY